MRGRRAFLRRTTLACAAIALLLAFSLDASADHLALFGVNLVQNGDAETGDTTGWTTTCESGSAPFASLRGSPDEPRSERA